MTPLKRGDLCLIHGIVGNMPAQLQGQKCILQVYVGNYEVNNASDGMPNGKVDDAWEVSLQDIKGVGIVNSRFLHKLEGYDGDNVTSWLDGLWRPRDASDDSRFRNIRDKETA